MVFNGAKSLPRVFVKEAEAKKETVVSLKKRIEDAEERKESLRNEIKALGEKNEELTAQALETREAAAGIRNGIRENEDEIRALIRKRDELEKSVSDNRALEKTKAEEREKISGELIRLEEKKAYLEKEQQDIERKLYEEYQLTKREAEAVAERPEDPKGAQKRLHEIKGSIRALGSVNVGAIEEYKEVSERYEFMSTQVGDVEKSKKEVETIIKKEGEQATFETGVHGLHPELIKLLGKLK